ncbi:glycosyltransferase family 2 protein [Nitrospirota bacterium]
MIEGSQNNLISVVVPVFKAEGTLHELYRRIKEAVEGISGVNLELILVEDCGGDDSWKIIRELASTDHRVRGISFSRNFGQHHGITAGIDHARGDWVVVMDCDFQDRPEEIPALYAIALEGYDVVLARRANRRDPVFKKLSSRMFYKVFSYLADIEYDSSVGNFRIISRRVVKNLRRMREQARFFGGQVKWMGFPTTTVDVRHEGRSEGRSNYTFSKLWKFAWEAIFAYSDKPLRISVRVGFGMSFLAFLYGLWIAYKALFIGVPVPGWSSLMVSLYFIGGMIIANLGLLGIYVGKTFDEAKGRPLYVVNETTFSEEEDND